MRSLVVAVLLFLTTFASAQIVNPVKWSYAAKKISKTEAVVLFKATIDNGWHLYSQNIPDGGPVATKFEFSPSKAYTVTGKTSEPKPVTKFEKVFNMNVSYFEKSVVFQQKVKLAANQAVVKGKLEFMVCNDHQCLPPDEVDFSIAVK
ncbi:protein-disulfide reductase DsbD N-terminal domain-containing protein [Desertivirga arenae]|uniref:protein-disulfide reductase DsbD N-terminal domain-containing protein n=1 Tax=Desertivirga arenae TaxID=2810309 RepID=UPI001A9591E8|nr:protein-disulfide reductase DsbD N-terminal domain-containing protein [Pedobacter sp. SYSU D00823]